MNLNLFTPCLLFSKMTDTLDPVMLLELWTEPVIYLVYGCAALLWTRAGGKMLSISGDYGRLLDVAVFFSNTNTLPVSLIKSIALSSGAAFLLRDSNDTKERVAARGISYAMIFATLNNILRWSLGMMLMGQASPSKAKRKALPYSINPTPEFSNSTSRSGSIATIYNQERDSHVSNSQSLGLPHQPNGNQNTDINETTIILDRRRINENYGGPGEENYSDSDSEELSMIVPSRRPPNFVTRIKSFARKVWDAISPCLNMPVYAILLAFIIICIPSLHADFKNNDSIFYTIWATIDMCGDACVPIVLISLGGQLGLVKDKYVEVRSAAAAAAVSVSSDTTFDDEQETQILTTNCTTSSPRSPRPILTRDSFIENSMQNRGIFLVLTGRFVFVPTISVCVLTFLRVYLPKAIPLLAEDPVFMLTLFILSATPPAINLITVAQATGKFQDEAARVLLWGYLLGIVVLAIEFSGFLWLTNALKVSN